MLWVWLGINTVCSVYRVGCRWGVLVSAPAGSEHLGRERCHLDVVVWTSILLLRLITDRWWEVAEKKWQRHLAGCILPRLTAGVTPCRENQPIQLSIFCGEEWRKMFSFTTLDLPAYKLIPVLKHEQTQHQQTSTSFLFLKLYEDHGGGGWLSKAFKTDMAGQWWWWWGVPQRGACFVGPSLAFSRWETVPWFPISYSFDVSSLLSSL